MERQGHRGGKGSDSGQPEALNTGVNHRPPATGLFLEGKVGCIVEKELKEGEGKTQNWLEDDLTGLSMRGKKSFFPLLGYEKNVSKQDVKEFHPP